MISVIALGICVTTQMTEKYSTAMCEVKCTFNTINAKMNPFPYNLSVSSEKHTPTFKMICFSKSKNNFFKGGVFN